MLAEVLSLDRPPSRDAIMPLSGTKGEINFPENFYVRGVNGALSRLNTSPGTSPLRRQRTCGRDAQELRSKELTYQMDFYLV